MLEVLKSNNRNSGIIGVQNLELGALHELPGGAAGLFFSSLSAAYSVVAGDAISEGDADWDGTIGRIVGSGCETTRLGWAGGRLRSAPGQHIRVPGQGDRADLFFHAAQPQRYHYLCEVHGQNTEIAGSE